MVSPFAAAVNETGKGRIESHHESWRSPHYFIKNTVKAESELKPCQSCINCRHCCHSELLQEFRSCSPVRYRLANKNRQIAQTHQVIQMPRLPRLLLQAPFAFLLCSCSHIPRAHLRQVQVEAANDANILSATDLDIVFVYKPGLASSLPKSAAEWFAQKRGIVAASPSAFDVVALQVPAGMSLQSIQLPARHGAATRILSYANYLTAAGQSGADMASRECVRIVLERKQPIYADCR